MLAETHNKLVSSLSFLKSKIEEPNFRLFLNYSSIFLALFLCACNVFKAGQVLIHEGNFVAIGTLTFNLLMCLLLLFRTQEKNFSVSFDHFLAVIVVQFLPFLLQFNYRPKLLLVALPFYFVGMLFSLMALINLGRSFGIIASNRGIKTKGLYSLVRHPLYLGELIWFLSLIIANSSIINLVVFCLIVACQVKRIFDEEALLKQDSAYSAYMQKVNYRLLPNIF